jgi:EAL domain-containing protein (putative c-di-GMP-specific phosphodiesterase class I)
VNVDAQQLQHPEFTARLHALLDAHPDVKPGDLELEVLETSALNDMEQVSAVMNQCNTLGVGFALDDFGTGYASLTYLRRLPAGLLKIDQSFVRDMLDDADDLALMQGVIGLANTFRRQVIAEGVETLAQGRMLLSIGCEWGQGFVIARPMPGADVPGWASTWRPDPSWQHAPVSAASLASPAS